MLVSISKSIFPEWWLISYPLTPGLEVSILEKLEADSWHNFLEASALHEVISSQWVLKDCTAIMATVAMGVSHRLVLLMSLSVMANSVSTSRASVIGADFLCFNSYSPFTWGRQKEQSETQLRLKQSFTFRIWLTCHRPANQKCPHITATLFYLIFIFSILWLPGVHWHCERGIH